MHVIPGLDPRSGGPSRAVVDVTDELARRPGLSVTLMYQVRADQQSLDSHPKVHRVGVPVGNRMASALGLAFRRELERRIRRDRPSLIHVHGLWHPVDHWAAASARRHRIPLIIQPHGMLEAWALEHRGTRKRVAMRLYQRRDLRAASLLVASTPREMGSFRALGLRCPIAVIPHGVRTPADVEMHEGGRPRTPDGMRTVLFLSRLHPVKGLPTLLDVWARLRPGGWRLVIAGPDEAGHLQQLQAQVRRLEISDSVQFVGEVRDDAKSALFRCADLFVLPTHSENFGIVIAEALAHGVPVITTKGAPWAEIESYRCGWWIDVGEGPLIASLSEAISMSDSERRKLGGRAAAYARTFSWPGIAARFFEVYGWLLGRVTKPGHIVEL